jgi:hypothetical protein
MKLTTIIMKKIIFSTVLILSCLLIKTADAQVRVNVGVNLGSQPDWGPVGYETANYYYIPDIDAYYDVPARQYVYYSNNGWIYSSSLPPAYSNYNIYNGYKVVINSPKPWTNHNFYKTKYVGYKGRKQVVIRDKKVKSVTNIKVQGNNGNGGGNGHGGGNGKGNGKGHGKH